MFLPYRSAGSYVPSSSSWQHHSISSSENWSASQWSQPKLTSPRDTVASASHHRTQTTYAEFFRIIGRHRIPVFRILSLQTNGNAGPLGRGGTFVARWSRLDEDLTLEDQSISVKPFFLKSHANLSRVFQPKITDTIEAGTIIASKHVNIGSKFATPDPTDYLTSFVTEALVLSHPAMQRSPFFPGIIGFHVEESPNSHAEIHQYPVLLLEIGSSGNLEEWFRGMWRAKLVQPKRHMIAGRKWLQFTDILSSRLVLSWKRKMRLASQLASALATLHNAGVVHGDVKMENVLCCAVQEAESNPLSNYFPQLCDLGSCVLLSDIPPGTTTTLPSRSFPWDAPESEKQLSREGLIRTDIYSFGLLLARIFLDGNDPFDENYRVISGGESNYSTSLMEDFQEPNTVIEHVIGQILNPSDLPILYEDDVAREKYLKDVDTKGKSKWNSCAYTEVQGSIIRILMERTLKSFPAERLGDMNVMAKFLGQVVDSYDDDLERLVNFNWKSPFSQNLSYHWQDELSWLRRDTRFLCRVDLIPKHCTLGLDAASRARHLGYDWIDTDTLCRMLEIVDRESFQNDRMLRYADEETGVPNLLDPTFRHLLKDELFTRDLFLQLRRMADNDSAQAALQTSWCFLHGWGVSRDVELFRQYMIQAVTNGSKSALENFLPVSNGIPSPPIIRPDDAKAKQTTRLALEAMRDAFYRHLDLSSAAFFETHFPEEFTSIIHCLRTTKADCQGLGPVFPPMSSNKTGFAHLLDACRVGDFDVIESAVRHDTIPNIQTDNGLDLGALLLQACAYGHAYLALYLLQEGANPDAQDEDFRTPVFFLGRFDEDMVENVGCMLLSYGAYIQASDAIGQQPLAFILNVENNFLPSSVHTAARFLIESGASIEGQECLIPLVNVMVSGDTRLLRLFEETISPSLHTTCDHTRDQIEDALTVKLIVLSEILKEPEALRVRKHGAWMNHTLHNSRVVSGAARYLQLYEVFATLVEGMPQEAWILAMARFRAHDLIKRIGYVDNWPHDLMEPMVRFGVIGDLDMARHYLRLGTKFDNTIDGADGQNLLHIAAQQSWPALPLQILCFEQADVVDVSAMASTLARRSRFNPFDLAVLANNYELANSLHGLGADSTSAHIVLQCNPWGKCRRDHTDDTAIHIVSVLGQNCTLLGQLLVAGMTNTNSRRAAVEHILRLDPPAVVFPDSNMNVFHVVWERWIDTPKSRIQPESKDSFEDTNKVFDILLAHFTDQSLLNTAESRFGYTPLHFAAVSGNTEGVRRLLELGVDVNAASHNGKTAHDLVLLDLFKELGITSAVESGDVRSPVGRIVAKGLDAWMMFDVLYALRPEKCTDTTQNVHDIDHTRTESEGISACHHPGCIGVLNFVLQSPPELQYEDSIWGRYVTEYTLVEILPPAVRRDLGSFKVALIPPEWYKGVLEAHQSDSDRFMFERLLESKKALDELPY